MSVVLDLMNRNLFAVFGERDPAARAGAAARTYAEDVVFHDPDGTVTGRDAVVAKAAELLDGAPGFVFAARGPVRESAGSLGVLDWRFGPADGPPVATGTDVALIRDGLIRTLHTLIDA
jgi:hypothetical protein